MKVNKKILMRGGKSPLTKVTYEETLKRNLLGTNSGNLIFADSVFRTLYTENATIEISGYSAKPKTVEQAAKINEEYDLFVLPFANAFRKDFLPLLDRFTSLINLLNIPVVVTGIGAQATTSFDLDDLDFMNNSVTEFCKSVLRRSASIGVRGELTKRYLLSLGFEDNEIDVIGCPSMFYHGPNFPKTNKADELLETDHISVNISPNLLGQEEIFELNAKHYPNMDYVTQNNESLDQILWMGLSLVKHEDVFPQYPDHGFFTEDKVRIFIDVRTWLNHLKEKKFVFGTRIHGNVAGLLAGTPSFVLAHDSRTLELAEYFEIPHAIFSEISGDPLAEKFFEEADYAKMHHVYPDRFKRWINFLERNGVDHVYKPENDSGSRFDSDLEIVDLAPGIQTFQNQPPHEILARLTERTFEDTRKNSTQISKLSKKIAGLESQNKKLKDEHARQKEELKKYKKELEKRTFWYVLFAIKRKLSAVKRKIVSRLRLSKTNKG